MPLFSGPASQIKEFLRARVDRLIFFYFLPPRTSRLQRSRCHSHRGLRLEGGRDTLRALPGEVRALSCRSTRGPCVCGLPGGARSICVRVTPRRSWSFGRDLVLPEQRHSSDVPDINQSPRTAALGDRLAPTCGRVFRCPFAVSLGTGVWVESRTQG